jgi:DNA-binding beta-propeller fold protein YncE
MGMISTYAGTGSVGWTGDGGAATAATFNYPSGIAVDDSQNVYIAEGNNDVIRMINKAGIIYTIAGTSVAGFSGDDSYQQASSIFCCHQTLMQVHLLLPAQ